MNERLMVSPTSIISTQKKDTFGQTVMLILEANQKIFTSNAGKKLMPRLNKNQKNAIAGSMAINW
ncbi:MAG: hypothetical protein K1X55_12220 [Chitinophagales bacterium]|nr:hypothetical protein [Chitinophagales bacterium]